jgi:hypothetical protein
MKRPNGKLLSLADRTEVSVLSTPGCWLKIGTFRYSIRVDSARRLAFELGKFVGTIQKQEHIQADPFVVFFGKDQAVLRDMNTGVAVHMSKRTCLRVASALAARITEELGHSVA